MPPARRVKQAGTSRDRNVMRRAIFHCALSPTYVQSIAILQVERHSMRIDRNELICGVRPAILKKLFRRDNFDTLTAMRELGLVEPQASQTLAALERDDWIAYDGCANYIGRWRTRRKAHRLRATPLIKRFPIREGRRIAAQVVDEARQINCDPRSSRRVTAITLFGSVLTGGDEDEAGDIDLVIDVERRILTTEEMKRITLAEDAEMPESLDFIARLYRVEHQILRRLKKISNKISVHKRHDVETFGAPHRLLYAYDIERERELPVDTAIRQVAKPTGEAEVRSAPSAALCQAPTIRTDWPVARSLPSEIAYLDTAQVLRAQHMWINRAPLADIARATRMPEEAVVAYLASRRTLQTSVAPFRANLRAMIGATIALDSNYSIATRVSIQPGSNVCVTTEIRDTDSFVGLASIQRLTPSSAVICHGRCDLLPLIEPGNAAAWTWYQKMRLSFKGFGLELSAWSRSDGMAVPSFDTRPIDFQPLRQPMVDLLKSRLPVPRSRFEVFAHRIELCFGDAMAINHHVSRESEAKARRISKGAVDQLWEMAREYNETRAKALGVDGPWTLYVDARSLPDRGFTPGEIIED